MAVTATMLNSKHSIDTIDPRSFWIDKGINREFLFAFRQLNNLDYFNNPTIDFYFYCHHFHRLAFTTSVFTNFLALFVPTDRTCAVCRWASSESDTGNGGRLINALDR